MATAAATAVPGAHDDELVAALRAGDERAFLQLVRQHGAAMLRVASFHVSSRALAEEVAQEAWLGVLRGLDSFEGRAPLKAWIFRIVVNCARSRGLRESRSVPFSALGVEGDDEPAVDPSCFRAADSRWAGGWVTPPARWSEQQLLDRETAALAHQAIAALPQQQREVITLRDVEGFSAEEVCAVLAVSEGNQRVLLHRARSKVRAALERHLGQGAGS